MCVCAQNVPYMMFIHVAVAIIHTRTHDINYTLDEDNNAAICDVQDILKRMWSNNCTNFA